MTQNSPDGHRLTEKQHAFVRAYTDPSDAETFGNATRAAIKAGYSETVARQRGYKLLQLPKVQEAIEELRAQVRNELALERVEFVQRALKASDAWLDPEGEPKRETYATNTGKLYDREARPSIAEVKALELAGRASGLVREQAGPSVSVTNLVVQLPPKAESPQE